MPFDPLTAGKNSIAEPDPQHCLGMQQGRKVPSTTASEEEKVSKCLRNFKLVNKESFINDVHNTQKDKNIDTKGCQALNRYLIKIEI